MGHKQEHNHKASDGSGAIETDQTAKFGDGGIANYIKIAEATGKLTAYGLARFKKMIQFTPYDIGAINGTYNGVSCQKAGQSYFNGMMFKSFTASSFSNSEAINLGITLPKDFVDGSDIELEIPWTIDGTSGAVRWQVGIAKVSEGETYDGATYSWITPRTEQAPNNAMERKIMQITLPDIGLQKDDDISIIVFRDKDDNEDTYGDDAYIFGMVIKYLSDRIGEET